MTGISLLAYLAHCETPLSEECGENVLKGISFLVDLGMKNPVISEQPALKEICYDPVSYTHLDVYKRQALGLDRKFWRRAPPAE